MAFFAVRMGNGPAWDSDRARRDQDAWDEHAAFMDALVADGFVIIGGPIGNGEQTMHAVEAADESEIRRRLAEDPWATKELLRVVSVEPWTIWLDGRNRTPG